MRNARYVFHGAMLICLLLVSFMPTAVYASKTTAARTTSWARAWPMVGHDPRRTNRGPSVGPLHPRILFTYRDDCSSPIIGADSRIYSWCARTLTALDAAGHVRWTVPGGESEGSPPALAPDGMARANGALTGPTIPRTLRDQSLAVFAVTSQGRLAWTVWSLPWSKDAPGLPFSKGMPPLVTSSGLLYMPLVG
ncbi:MAG: hypothetical protein ACRDIE_22270, partial [Chloroflexota bacterium]